VLVLVLLVLLRCRYYYYRYYYYYYFLMRPPRYCQYDCCFYNSLTHLASLRYCLHLRGATTTSRRLFDAIAAGCVPVVVADGANLPFASQVRGLSAFFLLPRCCATVDSPLSLSPCAPVDSAPSRSRTPSL